MKRKEVHCTYTYEDSILEPPNAVLKGGDKGSENVMEGVNLLKVICVHM
jgi:hypothetical protein